MALMRCRVLVVPSAPPAGSLVRFSRLGWRLWLGGTCIFLWILILLGAWGKGETHAQRSSRWLREPRLQPGCHSIGATIKCGWPRACPINISRGSNSRLFVTGGDGRRAVTAGADSWHWRRDHKEIVSFHEVIGTYFNNETMQEISTTWGAIHYSKKGCHLVPAPPRKEDE